MQVKGWQEHINKKHFIVNSTLPVGRFSWFMNQPCFEFWAIQLGSLFTARRVCQFRHTQQYYFQWWFKYRQAQSFLRNPAGSKLALCKVSLLTSLVWCVKCKLKVLRLKTHQLLQKSLDPKDFSIQHFFCAADCRRFTTSWSESTSVLLKGPR